MPQSQISDEEVICRFVTLEDWDEERQEPSPNAFNASEREMSAYHPGKVEELGDTLRDLCFERFEGAGEAHLQVGKCIELGQDISDQFNPNVYWRPDKVTDPWEHWRDAHAQIESEGGNKKFPLTYRTRLVRNSMCVRPPDGIC